MGAYIAYRNKHCNTQYCRVGKDSPAKLCENANMKKSPKAKKPTPKPKEPAEPNFLKEWREWAGLTQDELAELIGTNNNSQISLLETGGRKLSRNGREGSPRTSKEGP